MRMNDGSTCDECGSPACWSGFGSYEAAERDYCAWHRPHHAIPYRRPGRPLFPLKDGRIDWAVVWKYVAQSRHQAMVHLEGAEDLAEDAFALIFDAAKAPWFRTLPDGTSVFLPTADRMAQVVAKYKALEAVAAAAHEFLSVEDEDDEYEADARGALMAELDALAALEKS